MHSSQSFLQPTPQPIAQAATCSAQSSTQASSLAIATLRYLVLAMMMATLTTLYALPVAAATFSVNTTLDGVDSDIGDNLCVTNVVAGGACTLRAAIQQANASRGPDFILLPDGVYLLTLENQSSADEQDAISGDLDINSNIVISGTSAANTIISAREIEDRVFHLNEDAVVRISRVTIRDGVADRAQATDGGAIRNNGGNLELLEVYVTNNRARQFGGAIESFGTLTIIRSTFYSNTAAVLGIARGGAVSAAQNSIFRVYNSTFSHNRASSRGGALDIRNNNNEALLNNVTIVDNQVLEADGEGGGIYVGSGGGKLDIANTLIARNTDLNDNPNDCDGQPNSLGYNLIQSLTNCTINGDATGNVTGQLPMVGVLQDNGGQTPTIALLANSPAVDAGNPAVPGNGIAACRVTDQRGRARLGRCDIGAYELIFQAFLPYLED